VKRICLPNSRPRGYGVSFLQRKSTGQQTRRAGEPTALMQRVKHRSDHTVEELLTAVSVELKQGRRDLFDIVWEELSFLGDVEQLLALAAQPGQITPPAPAREPTLPVYVVNSIFLADCHRFLLSDAKGYELMHLVTGSKVSASTRTLDRMEQVALASHSAIHAEADQHDLQRRLIGMSEWGLSMHGLFHAHPGQGIGATRPSGKDLNTHERYERGGYPLVGAIFVRDGYVRFFSHNRPFTIHLSGTGVRQYEEHVFKIENPGRFVSYETPKDRGEQWQVSGHPEAGAARRVQPAGAPCG
jgi:hypothetical protein